MERESRYHGRIERIADAYPNVEIEKNLAESLLDLACIQIIHSKCFSTNPRIDGFEYLLLSDIEGTVDDCLSSKKKREQKET